MRQEIYDWLDWAIECIKNGMVQRLEKFDLVVQKMKKNHEK